MRLTISGRNVPLTSDNVSDLPDELPVDALPDCERCPKPELLPANYEAVGVYHLLSNQQNYLGMEARRGGIRIEALIAVLNDMDSRGEIEDRERTIRRVLIMDEVINRTVNAQLDALRASSGPAS